ncbi:MAG: hypothetical protein ACRC37_05180 [Lentisphaeria bacterium]
MRISHRKIINMDLLTQAKINRLLQLREQIYERIKDTEENILEVAGFNFPLPAPPIMPSCKRSVKLKINRVSNTSVKIPALKKSVGNAYQFTYILDGKKSIDLIKDIRVVKKMLALSMSNFVFLRLDSVYYDGGKVSIVENIDVNLKVTQDNHCNQ